MRKLANKSIAKQMKKSFALLVIFIVTIPSIGLAQSDDLLSVYLKAKKQDSVYEVANYSFEVSREKLPQALASLLPTVNLNANVNSQDGVSSFGGAANADRHVRNRSWIVQFTQPVYRYANKLAYDQATLQAQQAYEQFQVAEQDLILRVAQAYLDQLVSEQNIVVAKAQILALEQQLILAKRNFEVGATTITDTYEAKSRFDLARAQEMLARNDLEVKRAELEKILGEPTRGLASFSTDLRITSPTPADVQTWIDIAEAQNPQVRVAQVAIAVADKEIAKGRAGHQPTLDLTGNYGNNYTSGSVSSPANISSQSRSSQIGLQLTIPLYAGGSTNSKVREALASRSKAFVELEATKRQVVTQARQAFAALMNSQVQIEALSSAVVSSKSALDANKIGYKTGTRINTDVLNAEQQLFSAQRDLFKAKADALVQGMKLKAAAGSLAQEDLEAVNQFLSHSNPTIIK